MLVLQKQRFPRSRITVSILPRYFNDDVSREVVSSKKYAIIATLINTLITVQLNHSIILFVIDFFYSILSCSVKPYNITQMHRYNKV